MQNVYQSHDMSIDGAVLVKFYPEIVNYYWRTIVILHDHNDKKALVLRFETAIMSFVTKNKTRTRGDTRTTETEK